ncbi:alpha/beta hydrolase [Roseivirga sp. UBA1976]|uniref:alpha/beta fold hydrolase n=1 Tax=Roseivirga sp. UBA1976 TaxID=1947386 RepID=UPI00257E8C03|nr:alpha/beta hydrolase [Roseivirga sp. UBA1976]|tara:strand:+ start:6014 stop:6772 length:759 start_codon:yes stop_codon:yes gene_type:complete
MQLYNVQRLGGWNQHLVMIHGNSSSSQTFQKILDSDLPVNMTAIDLPGHGKSPRSDNPSKDYSVKEVISCLREFILKLNAEIIIYGNSLGGHYAMELINEIPDSIDTIVISGAPPVSKPPVLEEVYNLNEHMMAFFQEELTEEQAKAAMEAYMFNKQHLPELVEGALNTDPKCRSVIAEDLNKGVWSDQKAIVENSAVHVYYIHGLHDPAIKLDYVKSVKNIEKIYEIKRAGHYPQLENPKEVITAISEILL